MIRRAEPGDVPRIADLEQACFEAGAWSADQVRASLAFATRVVWLDDDGYVMTHSAGGTVDLERIAVAPHARRQGLARRLFDVALAHARSEDAEQILIEVAAENAPALAFYTSIGADPIDRRRDYYGPGEDAVILRKAVAP